MSFGFSISDFVTVPAFAWKVYTSCKESSQSYKDLSGEVCSLHIVLREVEEYVSRYPLEGDGERRLLEVGKGCHDVLKDLEGVLERYESLGTHSQRTWDRMRWGLEDVSRIRERLISNTALLTALNTTLSSSSIAGIARKLDKLARELRAGKRQASIATAATIEALSTEETSWSQLQRELEDIGISATLINRHRAFIVGWFQRAFAAGLLDETSEQSPEVDSVPATSDPITIPRVRSPRRSSEGDLSRPVQRPDRSTREPSGGVPSRSTRNRRRARQTREPSEGELFQSSQGSARSTPEPSDGEPSRTIRGRVRSTRERSEGEQFRSIQGPDRSSREPSDAGQRGSVTPVPSQETRAYSTRKRSDGEQSRSKQGPLRVMATPRFLAAFINSKFSQLRRDRPLHHAVLHNDINEMDTIIRSGVAIDSLDKDGWTALHMAACFGYREKVRLLLECGADVDARHHERMPRWYGRDRGDTGDTALHKAASVGHENVVCLLLDYGADVDAQESDGYTPLHLAVNNQDVSIVRLLLKRGARFDMVNYEGHTILGTALSENNDVILDMLLRKVLADSVPHGGQAQQ